MKKFFKRLFCRHEYKVTRWRLVHYREEPLTRQVEMTCPKCGKTKILFGVPRDLKWETDNIDKRTYEIF